MNEEVIFTNISKELELMGYIVERLSQKGNNNTQYLIFYRQPIKVIYGIESSKTFPLNDIVKDLPDLYFHIGNFCKYDNNWGLSYFTFLFGSELAADKIVDYLSTKRSKILPDDNILQEYLEWLKINELTVIYKSL